MIVDFGIFHPACHARSISEGHSLFRVLLWMSIMGKEWMHDPLFLAGKSLPAGESDRQTAEDLLDTLKAHKDTCVGMAANMIGVKKRIVAFLDESSGKPCYTILFNPVILKKDGPYETEEGCLSLLGGPKKCKRYRTVKVQFQNERMQLRVKTYRGFTAQILQHEIDHCDGVLI